MEQRKRNGRISIPSHKRFSAHEVVAKHLARAGVQPAGTLLGVVRLAFPELMVEIEATAVK